MALLYSPDETVLLWSRTDCDICAIDECVRVLVCVCVCIYIVNADKDCDSLKMF